MQGNLRKYAFVVILCFVIGVLVFSGLEGKKQDNKYLADYFLYDQARKNINESNLSQAIKYYKELLNKPEYNRSIAIHWELAQALKYSGNHLESAKYYEAMKRYYPAIVSNQIFLKEYGEVLSLMNDDRAEKYLKRLM